MSITPEMVFEAADALVAAGETPKVIAIREYLGKGSYSTINKAMQEWRAAQKAPAAPQKEQAPQALTDLLNALGADIWKVAGDLAAAAVKAEREEIEALRLEMDEQQHETALFADKLASDLELMTAKFEEKRGVLEVERNSHEATRRLLEAEQDEVIKLTAQIAADARRIEEDRQRFEKLSADYQAATDRERQQAAELARVEAKLANAEENKERAYKEREQAIEEAKAAKVAESEAKLAEAALKGEVSGLQKQLEQQAKLLESLTAAMKKEPAGKKAASKEDAAE